MYLASEIWKQYVLYASGNTSIKKDEVILLKNLKFSLTDIDNLVIDQNSVKVVDSERVSNDNQYSTGYIQFNVSLKNGSQTNIKYDGTQYLSKNGYLSVDEKLSNKLNFPLTIKWNINTYNKFFVLKDNEGNLIKSTSESPNVYKINLDSSINLSKINKTSYSNSITASKLKNL